jgi:hypothetical protein
LSANSEWQITCSDFLGDIDNHLPSDKLLQLLNTTPFVIPRILVSQPIPHALMVLTDGSSSGKAACTTYAGK